ncbi:protein phosphatase 2C domain-containing protein [Nocardia sp. CC201C]|uniref:protein phosphatase 2C domain-containing protein n=1 Tax=Nocardia sp. CC201C TaxID=3044575 RepID=UPI0024A8FBB2|nr:protein phosphatase 2C domain-containing protein [Nocardia sp. CC201C]
MSEQPIGRVCPDRTLYAELDSHGPRIGDLGPLPAPRLAATATALAGVRADAGMLAGRWVAAVSLAGQSHTARGGSAQDSYGFTVARDGSALVLAVCDGLGQQADTAQIGAELLARLCVSEAAALSGAEVVERGHAALTEAIGQAVATLERLRDTTLGLTARELASTMVLCWLPLHPGGGRDMLLLRVGDCEAFTWSESEGYQVVYPDADDGPLNIVRHTLPCDDPRPLLEPARWPLPGAGLLILATDGLAGDLFDSPDVRDWLAHRWSRPCGPAWMVDSLRYRRQGSHDDRTAVVVWLEPLSA